MKHSGKHLQSGAYGTKTPEPTVSTHAVGPMARGATQVVGTEGANTQRSKSGGYSGPKPAGQHGSGSMKSTAVDYGTHSGGY